MVADQAPARSACCGHIIEELQLLKRQALITHLIRRLIIVNEAIQLDELRRSESDDAVVGEIGGLTDVTTPAVATAGKGHIVVARQQKEGGRQSSEQATGRLHLRLDHRFGLR